MNPSIILNKDFGVIDKPFTRSSGIKLRKAITLPFLQPILCSTGQGFAGFRGISKAPSDWYTANHTSGRVMSYLAWYISFEIMCFLSRKRNLVEPGKELIKNGHYMNLITLTRWNLSTGARFGFRKVPLQENLFLNHSDIKEGWFLTLHIVQTHSLCLTCHFFHTGEVITSIFH
jgi:hypothetical protein